MGIPLIPEGKYSVESLVLIPDRTIRLIHVFVFGSTYRIQETSFTDILNKPDVRSHAFWTYRSGSGKVFGTTTGHYTYTFYDPMYRLLLMRGIAWALDEDPAPLMPLVFHGITNDKGLVGTTDSMFDYENRER